MHIFTLLLALAATSHAWMHVFPLEARRHDENSTAAGIEKTCRRIEVLTKLHDIANNETALDDMLAGSKFAQDRIDWIKSKSAETSTELGTLTANSILRSECNAISAKRDASQECMKLDQLEKLVDLANNQTALTAHTAADLLTQGQISRLQQQLEEAELKLQELKSNKTLMGLCASADNPSLQQNGAIGERK
jgi:hypothetical protein